MKYLISAILIFHAFYYTNAQNLPAFEVSEEWIKSMESLADSLPKNQVKKQYKILIFSLATGYEHWVIPHTNELVGIIGRSSEAFDVEISEDIFAFEKQNLSQYDAIVLNNSCSKSEGRNIFYDVLINAMSEDKAQDEASRLEKNLLKYVKGGGGLIVLHGGITMLNESEAFSEIVGGSFDYHPPQQVFASEIVNPNHPITRSFQGKPLVVVDEAYFLKGAYDKMNFEPLFSFDPNSLTGVRAESGSKIRYNAWVKRYGKGRVFYSAPSHNAQTFVQPGFLEFIFNGILYCLGDMSL